MRYITSLFVSAACLIASASISSAQVTVFAAASLTDSLKQLGEAFEKSGGEKVVFNFAASGQLARQIEAGAPADLFISADEARADALSAKGLLVPESRRSLLGNTLVIVAALENTNIHAASDLTNAAVKRIALGELKSVPCGTYAQAYFAKAGLWTAIEPKAIYCESVRAVLATVESGNVDAGVVYKSDTKISKAVKIVREVPAAEGPKITYPAALVKGSAHADGATKFFAFLQTKEAAEVFKKFGFIILDQ